MVETISPVVYGGRTRTYLLGVGLHALGATASGAAFGALLGAIGSLLGAPWRGLGFIALAAAATAYFLREAVRLPLPIPDRKRQVPQWWRNFYSPPVAALLYGTVLGVGFLTYLSFGTFVAVAVGTVAHGSPLLGSLIGGGFGLARAVAVAATRGRVEGLFALAKGSKPRLGNALTLLAVAGAATLAFLP